MSERPGELALLVPGIVQGCYRRVPGILWRERFDTKRIQDKGGGWDLTERVDKSDEVESGKSQSSTFLWVTVSSMINIYSHRSTERRYLFKSHLLQVREKQCDCGG